MKQNLNRFSQRILKNTKYSAQDEMFTINTSRGSRQTVNQYHNLTYAVFVARSPHYQYHLIHARHMAQSHIRAVETVLRKPKPYVYVLST